MESLQIATKNESSSAINEYNDAEVLKKNVYSELPKQEQHDLCSPVINEESEEIKESSVLDMNASSLTSSRSRMPSYSMFSSLNSSINFSSMLNESNLPAINLVLESLEQIKDERHCVLDEMNTLKNAMSLWNEGGLIPILGTFMSWISEANEEMNNLSNRLSSATRFISRFVKLYKKQQILLKNEKKKSDDVQFENEILRKANETLRKELLAYQAYNEQMQYLNKKHDDKQNKLISKLENIDNVNDDENENAMYEIEGVTIFDQSISRSQSPKSPKKKRFKAARVRTKSSPPTLKQKKVKKPYFRNTSARAAKRQNNTGNVIKPKSIVSRSRSCRFSKNTTRLPHVSKTNNFKASTPKTIGCKRKFRKSTGSDNKENVTVSESTSIAQPKRSIRRPRHSICSVKDLQ